MIEFSSFVGVSLDIGLICVHLDDLEVDGGDISLELGEINCDDLAVDGTFFGFVLVRIRAFLLL